jgi:hypothetical protein
MEKPDEKIKPKNSETETETEIVDENSEFNFEPYFEVLKDLLKDLNLENILENRNKVKIAEIQAKKQYSSRNLTFWKWKFTKEFAIILIILVTVAGLSYIDKIESSTIGTLLGSIIGYAIGNFNSKERKN